MNAIIEDSVTVRPQRNPAAWTIADICVLVLGCGLALSLPWLNSPTAEITLQSGLVPRWFSWAGAALEALQKLALAVLPLTVWRRSRLGAAIRPAELLLVIVVCGLASIQVAFTDWIWDGRHEEPMPGQPGASRTAPGSHWWLLYSTASCVSLAAAWSLIFGRRRLPSWLVSMLLIVGVLGFQPWLPDLLNELGFVVQKLVPSLAGPTMVLIVELACGFLASTISVIVAAAAVRDGLERGWRWSLLEWTGLAFAAIACLLYLLVSGFVLFIGSRIDRTLAVWLVLGTWIAPAVAGALIGWTLGPRWSRWLESA